MCDDDYYKRDDEEESVIDKFLFYYSKKFLLSEFGKLKRKIKNGELNGLLLLDDEEYSIFIIFRSFFFLFRYYVFEFEL